MTNGVWSWRLAKNIGFALVSRNVSAGTRVEVKLGAHQCHGELTELPFV